MFYRDRKPGRPFRVCNTLDKLLLARYNSLNLGRTQHFSFHCEEMCQLGAVVYKVLICPLDSKVFQECLIYYYSKAVERYWTFNFFVQNYKTSMASPEKRS